MMLAPFMDNRLAVECLLVHVDINVDISSPWLEVEDQCLTKQGSQTVSARGELGLDTCTLWLCWWNACHVRIIQN